MSFVVISTFGATVHFHAATDIEVEIYKPIDNMYNAYSVSDRLALKPELSISYKFLIQDFCFIQLHYSSGRKYIILLQEDDELSLYYNKGEIFCEGNNSAGIVYFNNEFVRPGLIRYTSKIDSIFNQNTKQGISCASIIHDLQYSFFSDKIFSAIRELEKNNAVSHRFAAILQKNLQYACYPRIINNYLRLLSGKMVQITHTDSINIKSQIDSIYSTVSPEDARIVKYNYGHTFANQYFKNVYDHLSLMEKDKLLNGYDDDTFGPYIHNLLAPDNIQLSSLGGAFLVQFNYMVDEFNKDKMIKYIEGKFPDSQYLKLIKERLKEIQTNEQTVDNDSITIINEQINTLNDLTSLSLLKGHHLFIDLWATWCLPCKAEFQYNEELYSVAKKYNVKLVYLSIDKPIFKKKWETDIFGLNLTGYHLLVNEFLLRDIAKVLYNNQMISIPRYLYVNEKGEIVNDNAPRPRSITAIEKMFSGK